MVFTIEDIKKRVIPIVIKYGINTFSLFGSYARGEATEDSDLDFVMDKGDLRGLQYVSLVQDLEDEFDCHVDVISKGSSNKKFLEAVSKEEVLLYERKR
ncbi:nucleotidyltransferase family protein [Methanobrevibacter sp.]|uniref:nucleotidyltransferase family protein n=1 Tax=Methanobrevibacter sp. TaxID=66852 RepID=UPI001B0EBE64|nr:nucleotidyltransferase domain-containing protein [Methanobrevibacter sp.]MBO7713458.1 nucleotidyltransferase domain-containing protein [Methanobrevibacter sp.]MBR0058451.1 nucleotidyltransferase domain-containing protein [Methanobrevibacter sp.]MBR0371585.1 nucleotidyltransferase domain-containing protein [Methanobrevibacter sp.]